MTGDLKYCGIDKSDNSLLHAVIQLMALFYVWLWVPTGIQECISFSTAVCSRWYSTQSKYSGHQQLSGMYLKIFSFCKFSVDFCCIWFFFITPCPCVLIWSILQLDNFILQLDYSIKHVLFCINFAWKAHVTVHKMVVVV